MNFKMFTSYAHKWLGLIRAPDISAWTFHHGDLSERGHFGSRTFWHGYISAPWMFRHRDVTALEHYSTRIFRHTDISAYVHFGTLQSNIDISAQVPMCQKYMCQNFLVPKCPSAKMSQCCNIPVLKHPWCQKIPMPKRSCAEMSLCQKVHRMKCLFLCRYVSIQ